MHCPSRVDFKGMKAVIPPMKSSLITHTIDWQAVERDYRAGVMSLREIGSAHGLTHGAINKRAKRDEWTRDLQAKIQAKAEALVSKALVSKEVSREDMVTERQIIDAGAQRIAQVRNEHRQDINRMRSLGVALLAELESQTFDAVLISQLGELMRSPDDAGMDRLNDIYRKVISTPGRVDTAKKLVETMKSVIAMEREAYSIDAIPADGGSTNALVTLLTEMKRSSLPIVYEVPRDDSL